MGIAERNGRCELLFEMAPGTGLICRLLQRGESGLGLAIHHLQQP